MKKGVVITLSLLVLCCLLFACIGAFVFLADESSEESSGFIEEPANVSEVDQQSSDFREAESDALIPLECLESDDAFWACDEEGLIPDACWDDTGEFVEACLDQEVTSSDDAVLDQTTPPQSVENAPRIPLTCFESDDAFWACEDQGLIPDECWNDADEFVEACYGEEDVYDEPNDSSENVVADTSAAEGAPPAGSADSGFRPEIDGFGFENYGGESGVANLTPIEMQRMFGEQVCANQANGCTLTPPARQWMEQMNESMDGGHCEGMAVLSSLMYYDRIQPENFGGNITNELSLGNDALQREIAYWFVTQATWPGGYEKVNESPSAVLDTLTRTFNEGKNASEWWALGIYKQDFSGGHAITPYAVEDQGNGIFHVYVYDNNYPNQPRILTINRDAETWAYEASTNPNIEADLYEGDASTETLEVVAISPRLQTQEGDFSEASDTDSSRGSLAKVLESPDVIQVWLDGDADLLITTEDGRRIGWLEDGSAVNEIEGAESADLKFGIDVWDINQEPVYLIPTDVDFFTVKVDGTRLEEATPAEVTIIGPGYTIVVEELWLDPGEQDEMTIATLGPQSYVLNYASEYSDSPDIIMGIETDEADYEFVVRGTDLEPGGAFNVALDYPAGDFILNTSGQEEYGIYQLLVLRIDDDGEYIFGHDEIELLPNDTMYANFLDWEGEGSSLYLDFDFESDGTLDDYIELEDKDDFYDDFYADWE